MSGANNLNHKYSLIVYSMIVGISCISLDAKATLTSISTTTNSTTTPDGGGGYNFVTNPNLTLTIGSGYSIGNTSGASVENNAFGAPLTGEILSFSGNATVTGTIGSVNPIGTINMLGGTSTVVSLQGNTTPGSGNLNFATGSVASSTLSLNDGVTVTGNINNTTGSANIGTLRFLGNNTVTGTIGATNTLSAINIAGGAGKTVNLQSNVNIGTGNLNFAAGSAATTVLNLSDNVTVTGNINNTAGAANIGTLNFLGNNTVTGTIGSTNTLSAINISGAGKTVNLRGATKVGTGNLNFAAGSDALTTLTIADAVTITGNIDNTTGVGNIGVLQFLGGSTYTGTIGATNTINAINITGAAGKTVALSGTTKVGSGNINFAPGSTATTTLSFSDGLSVTGNVDNTSGSASIGTLRFLGSNTFAGTIGATNSLNTINLSGGAGKTVNLQNNVTVGTGNLNFATGSTATSALSLSDGVQITGNINNTSGSANIGVLNLLGNNTITGTIGATNTLSAINISGSGKTVNLQGAVKVGTGNLDFVAGSTSATTLKIGDGANITGVIDNLTGSAGIGTLYFQGSSTISGKIGLTNSLNEINIASPSGKTVNFQGNVNLGSGNLNFANGSAASTIVTLADAITVTGNIDNTTGVSGMGTIQTLGGTTFAGTIGATNSINAINMTGAAGKVVNLQNTTKVGAGNINFGVGSTATTTLNIADGISVTGNIDNTSGAANIGTLQFLGNNTFAGTIGASNSINSINLVGGAGKNVIMQGNVNVGTGNLDFIAGSAATSALSLGDNVTVTGNINNSAGAANIGTLNFLGNNTVTGTIGSTNTLSAINISGAGKTVNLRGATKVGTGNLNFAAGSDASTTLTIADAVTITGNIDNTTGVGNIGVLQFLGGSTYTGTIGATNTINAINITGAAGKTVALSGTTKVGSGNINFAPGSTATTTLSFSDGLSVTGNVDNTSGSASIGTLRFLGSNTFAGTIGATNSLNAINLSGGTGKVVVLASNANIGAGNLNFMTGSAATSGLTLNDGVTVTGNINNTTGSANIGTLRFLGNNTVTGTIGATNTLSAINIAGGAGKTVNLQSNVNIGTGNLNFAAGSAATTVLNLSDNVTVTGNINNTAGAANIGTLNFLGNNTVTGTIGSTNTLSAINISGAGKTVNLRGATKVGTGNLNFAAGSDALTTLTIADAVTITGNIDNTTGVGNIGVLQFLGGSTYTGTIGATNTINAINITGAAGKTVALSGTTKVGSGNINFAPGSTATTTLSFSDGLSVTGNVDNTTGGDDIGILRFLGSNTFAGTIGATNSLNAINLSGGTGKVVVLASNANIGAGNLNFMTGSAATSGLTLNDGVTVTGNINNTTGSANIGTLRFLGNNTVTGTIGATNTLSAINIAGGAGKTVNLQSNVNIGTGNLNFAAGSAATTVLNLSDNVTVTANINNTAGAANIGTLNFLGNNTVTGTIGSTNTLSAINISGAGKTVNLRGATKVGTGNLNFAAGSDALTTLTIADAVTITGNIDNTTGVGNIGVLQFLGGSTYTGTIGATNTINAINITGAAGKTVALSGTTKVGSGNINFAPGSTATTTLSFSDGLSVTGNVDNTTGGDDIGILRFLGSNTFAGTIGATNSLNAINISGGAGKTVNLQGATKVGSGNINFITGATSTTTLTFADGVDIIGNVDSTVSANIGTLNFLGNNTLTGTIGATNAINALNLSGASKTVNLQGDTKVGAGNINFATGSNASTTLNIADGLSVTGNINNTTGTANIGVLQFLGSNTFSGTIGSTNVINALNLLGGSGKTVNLQAATKVGAGNINFAPGSTATSLLTIADGIAITGNIDNTSGSNNIGTLQFLGNNTYTGTIGATNSLNAINISGSAGKTVALSGTVNVGSGNINFAPGSTSTTTLSFADGVTVTGSVDNTTGGDDIGILRFLGSNTFAGTIGATNSLNAVNISGGAGKTVNLQGATKVGSGNINFITGATSTTTLTFADGVDIIGNVDSTAGANIGALEFFGDSALVGTVGITNPIYALNLSGADKTVTLLGSANVGTGNINFAVGSTPGSILNIANNVILTADVDNLTGISDTGTLNFLGNGTITGAIGATDSLYAINQFGGANKNVQLQKDVNVSAGNINFAAGSASTSIYTLFDGVTVTANIDNSTTNNDIGTLEFLGDSTVTGTIGASKALYAINLHGVAGKEVVLQGSTTVGAGNINFAPGSTSTTVLSFADGVNVTGNLDNTTSNNNIGTLNFLGDSTVTGSIGNTNIVNQVNLKGGTGKTVQFDGNVSVGLGNLNFDIGSTSTSQLRLSDGVTISGNINNTTSMSEIGVVNFIGNGAVNGSIGASDSLYAINQFGASKTVFYQENANVGTGNINFAGNANATSAAIFGSNSIVNATIDNITSSSGNGSVQFQESGRVTGNLGATNALNRLDINVSGAAGRSVELNGSLINVNTISINDDHSGVSANGTTLVLKNMTSPLILNGNITTYTPGQNSLLFQGSDSSTINGDIGSQTKFFNEIALGNHDIYLNGNVYASNIVFLSNNLLQLGSNASVFGTVTTTSNGQGNLLFTGNFLADSPLGASGNALNTINFHGQNTTASFNGNNVFANNILVDNSATLEVIQPQVINGNLTISSANLSLGFASPSTLNINGTFQLESGSRLQLDMSGANVGTTMLSASGPVQIDANSSIYVSNPPMVTPGSTQIFPIIQGGVGSTFNTIPVTSSSLLYNFATQIEPFLNQLELVVSSQSPAYFATQSNTIGLANAMNVMLLTPDAYPGELGDILAQMGTFDNTQTFNEALATVAPSVDGAIMGSLNSQLGTLELVAFDMLKNSKHKTSESGIASGDGYQLGIARIISFTQGAHQGIRHDIAGYKANNAGLAIANDVTLTDNILLGGGLSYSCAKINNEVALASKTIIKNYQAITYGQFNFDLPIFVNWSGAIAYNEYDIRHNLLFGTVNLLANGRTAGWQYSGALETGYRLSINNFRTIPSVYLYYSHIDLNDYHETGAGTANQAIHYEHNHLLQTGAELRFAYDTEYNNLQLEPELHFGLSYDFRGTIMNSISQFTIGGPVFGTQGTKQSQMGYEAGLGMGVTTETGVEFNIRYDVNVKESFRAHSAVVGFKYPW